MESTYATTLSRSSVTPLGATFRACREQDRAALVLYVTAGHPTPGEGLQVLLTLSDAGADVIELGVPFSDPLADGPTIQRSSFQAISQGVDLRWTLDLLSRFRKLRDTPIVLFSYLNPIYSHGVERFVEDAEAAGANGILLTDLPSGAAPEIEHVFAGSSLELIRLIAPTSTPDRIGQIAASARGFLYYVSRTGVTGAGQELAEGLEREVAVIRETTDLPVAVGFGISSPEQAREVARFADGVIVGSALVDLLAARGTAEAGEYVRSLRAAMERGALPHSS
ncbi:tryptophan synthase subunit alpha [soil metagenome]